MTRCTFVTDEATIWAIEEYLYHSNNSTAELWNKKSPSIPRQHDYNAQIRTTATRYNSTINCKGQQVLKDRIQRWQKFSNKKNKEIYKIKLSAARRIAALVRKSLVQLSQQKAPQYKSERSHMKSVVVLQNKVNWVNRDAEKILSWLKEECKEKVEAAEEGCHWYFIYTILITDICYYCFNVTQSW